MSETNIRISPEMMIQKSNEFNADAESFRDLHDRMKNRTENLATEWEGQASTSYIQQFHDLDPSFREMHELMTTIAAQLQQAGAAMQQADLDISRQLGVK